MLVGVALTTVGASYWLDQFHEYAIFPELVAKLMIAVGLTLIIRGVWSRFGARTDDG